MGRNAHTSYHRRARRASLSDGEDDDDDILKFC